MSITLSELRTQLTPQLAKSVGGFRLGRKQADAVHVSGYTIVEVMIVLAVSGMLVVSALALFRGTSQRTQFEQAVNDFSSKLQNSITGVSDELFPQTTQYKCSAGPTLVPLNGSSQEQSSNKDCIYLGKVFQVNKDKNTLKIYTVIGNRLCSGSDPACPANQLASTFAFTNPLPAITALTGGDLTETYTLSSGNANLISANTDTDTDPTHHYDLAGFYNGIGTDAVSSAQSGALNLLERIYQVDANTITNDDSGNNILKTCINEARHGCASEFKSWDLCFGDPGSNQNLRALVRVTATANAVQSSVKLKGC